MFRFGFAVAAFVFVGVTGALAQSSSSAPKTFEPSLYMQFQYRDSNEVTSSAFRGQHGLHFRRIRFGGTFRVDEATTARFVFDGVGGANQDEATLKEAFIRHTLQSGVTPLTFQFGQFPLPIGYELHRSSAEREMPEFSLYNRLLFPGEQIRGVMASATFGPGAATVGVFNALANDDPEQDGQTPSPGGRMAVFGRYQMSGKKVSGGVSGFFGERPAFVGTSATSPAADRALVALDLTYRDILPGMTLRSEYLTGRDRVGTAAGSAAATDKPLSGWHVQLSQDVAGVGTVFGRVGGFDPDTQTDGNAYQEYGLGIRRELAKGLTATVAFERIFNPNRPRSFSVSTFRIQYRF